MSPEDHAEDLARKLAGNHRRFESFGWDARPEDDSDWCIVYTHNRDSDALDRSNARIIARELEPFCTGEDDADCRAEHHGHWACGWVDGFAIRVRRNGSLTPAFLAYSGMVTALADYPVLDDEDFSREEEEEAQAVWSSCFRSDRKRLEYIQRHWSQFERCRAKWYPPLEAWRTLLANVRGRQFDGYASELCER